jgi:hypothetical protein
MKSLKSVQILKNKVATTLENFIYFSKIKEHKIQSSLEESTTDNF